MKAFSYRHRGKKVVWFETYNGIIHARYESSGVFQSPRGLLLIDPIHGPAVRFGRDKDYFGKPILPNGYMLCDTCAEMVKRTLVRLDI